MQKDGSSESNLKPVASSDKKGVSSKYSKKTLGLIFLGFCLLVVSITAVILGYLLYKENKEKKDLQADLTKLESEMEDNRKAIVEYEAELAESQASLTEYKAQLDELTSESTQTSDTNASLETQIASLQAKISKIDKINNLNEYIWQVVEAHGGFVGFTDAEYNVAIQKANATGDTTIVSAVQSAWNDTHIDPTVRVINLMQTLISKIDVQT